ncbi:Reticulon-like protein B18 [Dichanthelium oligosanthes]|uniref:Reticulon-like protein n=1 Tax=Dichanthelium oligosanthes TaxID=888268 RepID=A0A1E5VKC7_9POAL|nr:Reticulon-like protein B18 [Dichanthelium oligosanthes]
MEVMAADPSSPAPLGPAAALPEPPYHHPPADRPATPPLKPAAAGAGLRTPSPSPSVQVSGYSLHELLLLSPPPPSSRRHRSRTRGAAGTGVDESLEMVAVAGTPTPPRRRRRGAAEQCAAPALASPRNTRRARRRLEKDVEAEEDAARRARRRKSTRAAPKAAAAADKAAAAVGVNEEDTSMALVPACQDATHGTDFVEESGWEGLWEGIVELVMWRNVAKSVLWFGFGSMFFFSRSFSREITFRHVKFDTLQPDIPGILYVSSPYSCNELWVTICSPISALCHLGVMILGLAFFKDSLPQRPQLERGRSFRLTEEDVIRASQAMLPIANSMISTAQLIFSGEPSMTLKVLPVLLFGARYGSLVTVWRLLAAGFFTSFTVPKLYSCYSSQIHKRVEILRDRALEAWKSCPRKKLVTATAVTMCWNMFSVKTRVMAAFVSLVILRYNQKYRKVDINPGVEICQDDEGQKMEMDE